MDDFEMGYNFYSKKNYEDALVYFKKHFEEDKKNSVVLYNIGVCYVKTKEYEKAIDIFNQVLEMKSISSKTTANSLFNIGYSYSALKEIGKAYQYIARSWCINPLDEDCVKALTLIEHKLLKENKENIE